MAEDKKIQFSAQDAGLSSFMKKLQADGKSMYKTFADEAKKQTDNQKEQFKIIQAQIKQYKEALKIQKEITQERIKQAKQVLKDTPAHTSEGMMERVAAQRKLARSEKELNDLKERDRMASAASGENRRNPPKSDSKSESKSSILNDIIKAGLFRDIVGLIRQVPNQENGLGLLSPAISVAGAATGGIAGAAIDASNLKIAGTGLGDVHASTVLASLGKEAGAFFGDAITRSFKIRDQFDQSFNRYKALGGTDSAVNSGNRTVTFGGLKNSSVGFSDIDVAEAMARLSATRGKGSARSEALMPLLLSRGFGIDESTSFGAFGMERSGGGRGFANIQRALGVAIAEGLDRAKLTDAIQIQTQLLQHFSESNTRVSSIDANRAMFEFNRMGGMFSLGDPRGIRNIMGVSQGLSNPGSDFGQAQNYAVLRSLFPNADPFELRKREEQGLQTPGFLQGVMDQISSTGASDTIQKFMLKSRFGDLSYEAIDTLFKNKGQIGSMSRDELGRMIGTANISDEATNLTSKYTKMNAEVVNAFRDNFIEGIGVLKSQFVNEMGAAAKEVANILKDEFSISSGENHAGAYNPPGSKKPVPNGMYRVPDGKGGSFDTKIAGQTPKTYYH
jgi:hypothetical protein